ncbi:MAG: 2-keto-4-pentenoate hydratase [Bdellovibrio sp.]|nr:MAG: 2-keto-4-pentenoate hydratase [Bdellovibrio sp.]
MRLASYKPTKSTNNLDGELIVVSQDGRRAASAASIVPSLREAVERWGELEEPLRKLNQALNAGGDCGGAEGTDLGSAAHAANQVSNSFALEPAKLMAALPRSFLFADGSAFIHHIKLVRKARNAPLPETLLTVPLMYQAESGRFLSPTENIPQRDFAHGTDFEGEVGVITDFVPMGISADEAVKKIRLLVLINDVSLRGLIPEELAQGFGFFVSKPAKAVSPFALTPDELGSSWREGRLHLPLQVRLNGQFFGRANAGEMHFHFGDLIAHAAKTRDLAAGSLIGSGTVSNEDASVGSSCLAEKRTIEQIRDGKPSTPFLRDGDRVEIWMEDSSGRDLFGHIDQVVKAVK